MKRKQQKSHDTGAGESCLFEINGEFVRLAVLLEFSIFPSSTGVLSVCCEGPCSSDNTVKLKECKVFAGRLVGNFLHAFLTFACAA